MNSGQKLKFKLLGSLGYFYFNFILLFLLGIIAVIVFALYSIGVKGYTLRAAYRIGIPAVILVLGLFKGFFQVAFSKIPEPEGIILERKDNPYFYEILDDICKRTDSPDISCVKLDYSANAFISEQPSFGMFGLYKRYLVIGLPLFIILTEVELKAVIAHECGHLSKSHSKDSGRVYRAKLIWERINEELKKKQRDRVFFIRFFIHRYMPALNNELYSISKENEYQADCISAAIAGGNNLASALLKMHVYNAHFETNLWDGINRLNCETKNPPNDLYNRMRKEVEKPVSDEMAKYITGNLLKHQSLPNSSHPSFRERINALGIGSTEFNQTSASALEEIFKEKSENMLRTLSINWAEAAREKWVANHEETVKADERFRLLNDKYDKSELNIEEAFERSFAIERRYGIEQAMEVFNEIKGKYPEEIYVDYNIGRLMLSKGDDQGLKILKDIMRENHELIPDVCNELVNYYCYIGQKVKAARYYHKAVGFMKTNEDVLKERDSLLLEDTFIPHDLGYDAVMKVRDALINNGEVRRAYVSIKHIEFSGQFPLYVIGIEYKSNSNAVRKETQQKLLKQNLLPWEYWIVSLNDNRELDYKMNMIPESRIV